MDHLLLNALTRASDNYQKIRDEKEQNVSYKKTYLFAKQENLW